MQAKQYLERREAAEFLTSLGLRISHNTLAKYATVGGGPEFQKFGSRTVYQEETLRDWAGRRLGGLRKSTSDIGAQ